MNQRTKLIIFLVVAGFLILPVLIHTLFRSGRPGPEGQLTTPGGARVALPEVSFGAYTRLQPRTYLAPKDLPVPGEVRLYTLSAGSPSLTLAQAKSLAARLGFAGEPQVSQTVSGQNFVFVSATDDRLSLKENPLTISYSKSTDLSQAPPALSLSRDAAQDRARKFIDSLRLNLPQGFELKVDDTYYIKAAGLYRRQVTVPAEANQLGVDFGFYLDGHRLFEESSSPSLVRLVVGAPAEVVSAQIVLPFGLGLTALDLKSEGRVALESEKAIKEKIGRGEAVIKYLKLKSGRGDEEISQLPPTLALTSFEVGYLATTASAKNYLYPIYVFKVAGQLSDGKEIEGLVFLKASK